jgi:hypothetical protein
MEALPGLPKSTRRLRLRFPWWIVGAIVVAAAAYIAGALHKDVAEWYESYRIERRAMNYLAAPGQSAFRRLYNQARNQWTVDFGAAGTAAGERAVEYGRRFTPDDVAGPDYKARVSGGDDAVLFLHARANAKGQRLVVLNVEDTVDHSMLYFIASAYQAGMGKVPATKVEEKHIIFNYRTRLDGWPVRHDFGVNLYSGQPDPNDPSRFSVKYDCDNPAGSGYIDFHLKDDDTIEATVRDGPEKGWLSPEEFDGTARGRKIGYDLQ